MAQAQQEEITLDVGNAKLTVPTSDLLRAWLAQQLSVDLVQGELLTTMPYLGIPLLNEGELYAGWLLSEQGHPVSHLILLPGEREKINWQDAGRWAQEIGGRLPTRREQSLLIANLKSHFADAWYWSGEQHAATSGFAWSQYFDYGHQNDDVTSYEGRARAVRSVVIQ